jgi:hypothetical protein
MMLTIISHSTLERFSIASLSKANKFFSIGLAHVL